MPCEAFAYTESYLLLFLLRKNIRLLEHYAFKILDLVSYAQLKVAYYYFQIEDLLCFVYDHNLFFKIFAYKQEVIVAQGFFLCACPLQEIKAAHTALAFFGKTWFDVVKLRISLTNFYPMKRVSLCAFWLRIGN